MAITHRWCPLRWTASIVPSAAPPNWPNTPIILIGSALPTPCGVSTDVLLTVRRAGWLAGCWLRTRSSSDVRDMRNPPPIVHHASTLLSFCLSAPEWTHTWLAVLISFRCTVGFVKTRRMVTISDIVRASTSAQWGKKYAPQLWACVPKLQSTLMDTGEKGIQWIGWFQGARAYGAVCYPVIIGSPDSEQSRITHSAHESHSILSRKQL